MGEPGAPAQGKLAGASVSVNANPGVGSCVQFVPLGVFSNVSSVERVEDTLSVQRGEEPLVGAVRLIPFEDLALQRQEVVACDPPARADLPVGEYAQADS